MPFFKNLKHAPLRKKLRTIIILLIIILLIVGYFKTENQKYKNIILGTGAVAVGVLGIDLLSYEFDYATLWKTGSLESSRKEYVNGVMLIGDCAPTSPENDLDCDNFETQQEAQNIYKKFLASIKEYNKDVQDPINLDVYRLDGDKDGIVCEALPSAN